MRGTRVLSIVTLLAILLGFLSTVPAAGSAGQAPEQAVRLAYPLSRRFQVESLFDHNPPLFQPNNHLQIYTGAQVDCDGSPPND